MNPASLLPDSPFCTILAEIGANDPSTELSLQSAAIILLGVAVVWLWKAQADLRARLNQLSPPESPSDLPISAPPARVSETVGESDAPSPEILAVIAAAVHVTMKCRARVVGIRTVSGEHHAWSLEGRRQIFDSHRPR